MALVMMAMLFMLSEKLRMHRSESPYAAS